jgi:hypothetical protein
MSYNSEELLKTVTNVLTNVPKKALKNNFIRHCSVSGGDVNKVASVYKKFAPAYTEFKGGFAAQVTENDFLQRILVQLSTVSALLGKLDPETNDEFGLYAGCALFVAEWSSQLSTVLFDGHPDYAFYSLWSSVLNLFKVDRAYQGSTYGVLVSLSAVLEGGEGEDELEPFALCFPGPAPKVEDDGTLSTQSWSSYKFDEEEQTLFNQVFGQRDGQTRVPSKSVFYYNPADEQFKLIRVPEKTWAIDVMPGNPDVEEFEADDEEEDTGTFQEEAKKLQGMLVETVIDPPEAKATDKKK